MGSTLGMYILPVHEDPISCFRSVVSLVVFYGLVVASTDGRFNVCFTNDVWIAGDKDADIT